MSSSRQKLKGVTAALEAIAPLKRTYRKPWSGLRYSISETSGLFQWRLPDLMSVRELAGLLRLRYRPTLRWIHEHLEPIGGMVRITGGSKGRILIHAWSVAYLLGMGKTCPGCNRPWPIRDEVIDGMLKGEGENE